MLIIIIIIIIWWRNNPMEETNESTYIEKINNNFELSVPIEIQNYLKINQNDSIQFICCQDQIIIEKST